MLMPHITQKFRDNPEASKNANHSLAVFIKVRASKREGVSYGSKCFLSSCVAETRGGTSLVNKVINNKYCLEPKFPKGLGLKH
jgi:hypothetical protein